MELEELAASVSLGNLSVQEKKREAKRSTHPDSIK